MITEKQRQSRAKGIGSSEAGVIMGVDRWSTPYDLWLHKTGRVPPIENNDAMRLGTILEPTLLQLAGERMNKRVVRPSSHFVGHLPIYRANIDGMIETAQRGSDIVEIKTTGITEGWGTEGTDEVPEQVKVQVSYQMACASSNLAYVACLSGAFGLSFKIYRIPYDADFCEYILERVGAWWNKHIVLDEPPPEAGSLETLKNVSRNDSSIVLPLSLFEAEAAAKEKLKSAEEEYETAKATLVTALGDAKKGTCGGYSVTMTDVATDRFDRKAFELENAELAKQYIVPSGFKRIDIRKKKETA